MTEALYVKISGPIATVTLNRPEVHNAFDAQLAGNLTQAFQKLGVAEAVRVVVLEATGKSFCAGIDMGWLSRTAAQDATENQRDAMMLAMMLDAIDRCPKPVVAMVQGAALGDGAGLVAVADMAIASEEASFALSEVRLGLAPSIVAPYLYAAIGPRACRRIAGLPVRSVAAAGDDAVRRGIRAGWPVFPQSGAFSPIATPGSSIPAARWPGPDCGCSGSPPIGSPVN